MKKTLAIALAVAGTVSSASAFAEAADTSTATANSSVTIIRPLTITKNTDLVFGRVVQPRSGSGTVSISNASNTVAVASGAVALAGISTSHAVFTVDGEGGQVVTVAVPSTFDLTRSGGSETITVTTNKDVGATVTLSNALAAAGSKVVNVGGGFTLPSSQVSGAYAGTFDVTVAYQ